MTICKFSKWGMTAEKLDCRPKFYHHREPQVRQHIAGSFCTSFRRGLLNKGNDFNC